MYHAFISDGKLFIRQSGGALKEIASKFATEKLEWAERDKSLHSWKTKGDTQSMYFNPSVVWGGQAASRPFSKFSFKSVMVGDSDTLYYLLTNNYVTGLFKYAIKDDEELRLFHKNAFVEFGMDYSADSDEFVAAMGNEDGSVNLELLDSEGSYKQSLTGGDVKDSNPSFSRHNPRDVVYQTAGIARDEAGFVVAHSSEAINRINLDTNEITELAGDDQYDYLLPKEDVAGNLYCIRRPYRRPGYQSPLKTLLYVVMFPLHLLVAIVRFLNTFTKLFSGQPPRAAGPDMRPSIKNKYVRVLGQTIYLAKVERSSRYRREPTLVPQSWELVRFSRDGQMEVIAGAVSSFDVDQEGRIYFTNGFRVSELAGSSTATVFKHKIIENIRVVKVANEVAG
jgi:hypothetical protein